MVESSSFERKINMIFHLILFVVILFMFYEVLVSRVSESSVGVYGRELQKGIGKLFLKIVSLGLFDGY